MDESDNDGGVRDNCLSLPALEHGSVEHPQFYSLPVCVCVKRYLVHSLSNVTVIPVIHVFSYLMSLCAPRFIILHTTCATFCRSSVLRMVVGFGCEKVGVCYRH